MPTITVNFSSKGIAKLKKELQSYSDRIDRKTEVFVNRLARAGIRVGNMNKGKFGSAYTLYKTTTINDGENSYETTLIAEDKWLILKEWFYKGDIKQEEISPLLMAEYGSGWYADVKLQPSDISVGQGTFPNQKHAFDSDGWFWTTPDGELHHSYGEKPTYPVYKAYMEMLTQINEIAKETFK